jgi:hypothetical protein
MLEARNLLSTFAVDHLADDLVGSGIDGSLRYCITHAVDGDDIQFGVTGTINLTGALPDLTHSISIDGPAADQITVRRDTGGNYRIFTVSAGATVGVFGLTIANGAVSSAGGIYNSGTLTVSACALSGNTAYGDYGVPALGGGIYNSGTLTVSASTLSGNTIYGGRGGGIYNDAGTVTVSASDFSSNGGAGSGGGIYNDSGTLTVNASSFSSNMANGGGGGGIYNSPDDDGHGGMLTVNASTFSGNSAVSGGGIANVFGGVTLTNSTLSGNAGGGIYNFAGMLTVSASTLAGNAAVSGGGIDNVYGGVTLTTSTLSGNSAHGGFEALGAGGGIYSAGGLVMISASTLSDNSAHDDGGGIYNSGIESHVGTLTLTSSTVSGNHDFYSAGGIANAFGGTLHTRNSVIAGNTGSGNPDILGNLGSLGHNLIGNTQGGSGFDPTDLLNVDPLLGSLQDNGGPTKTRALMAGSPALNAGDPAQLGLPDQRGVVRTGKVNIGAYQASIDHFTLAAPDQTTAALPFAVTVTARDPFGQVATGYTGTAALTSTDPQNPSLGQHAFTLADGGAFAFRSVQLFTAGTQTLTASDGAVTGSVTVTVNPAAADHLLFLQQPTDTAAGQTITPAVTVAVVDSFGNVVTSDNSDTVTLSIGMNPGGGTLNGTLTVTVSGGIANFSDLSIDLAGVGYALRASVGGGLPDTDSNPFNITM